MKRVLLIFLLSLLGCSGSEYLVYNTNRSFDESPAPPIKTNPPKEEDVSKIQWKQDLGPKYINKAIQEDKFILIYFYNSWCPYCREMSQNTFSHEPIITLVNKKFYAFQINVDDLTELQVEAFGIESVPTVIIIKPNKEISKSSKAIISGYQDKDTMFMYLLEVVDKL